jgi:hypothetical protein
MVSLFFIDMTPTHGVALNMAWVSNIILLDLGCGDLFDLIYLYMIKLSHSKLDLTSRNFLRGGAWCLISSEMVPTTHSYFLILFLFPPLNLVPYFHPGYLTVN